MKYLLNSVEEQIFLDNSDLIRDLLSVLGAGGLIGLAAGLMFDIGWIFYGSVAMMMLFFGCFVLWLVLHDEARRRPSILMDTVPPEKSPADSDKSTPVVSEGPGGITVDFIPPAKPTGADDSD